MISHNPRAAVFKVSILGLARSPTSDRWAIRRQRDCFNTWAREEPNHQRFERGGVHKVFQYLGSRGAQRWAATKADINALFQYLGSRGAQHATSSRTGLLEQFQYLGSRGAQPDPDRRRLLLRLGFNTWAREEPNLRGVLHTREKADVSILGLARSPTGQVHGPGDSHRVSILGLARSPTPIITQCSTKDLWFQYLGSRGAQPETNAKHQETGHQFQYLGSRGAQRD